MEPLTINEIKVLYSKGMLRETLHKSHLLYPTRVPIQDVTLDDLTRKVRGFKALIEEGTPPPEPVYNLIATMVEIFEKELKRRNNAIQ